MCTSKKCASPIVTAVLEQCRVMPASRLRFIGEMVKARALLLVGVIS